MGELSLCRANAVLQCAGGVALGKMSSRGKGRARGVLARERAACVLVGSRQSSRGAITFGPEGAHAALADVLPRPIFQHDRRPACCAHDKSVARLVTSDPAKPEIAIKSRPSIKANNGSNASQDFLVLTTRKGQF